MAEGTSSAEPEQLYRYAAYALELDNTLQSEGRNLAETLRYFERQCKEPDFAITGSVLGDNLCTYGGSAKSSDEHVREVGVRFARADGQSLGSRAWMSIVNKWEKVKSAITSTIALVGITIGQILNTPRWLTNKLKNVSWIRNKDEHKNAESELGRLPQEKNSTVDTVQANTKAPAPSGGPDTSHAVKPALTSPQSPFSGGYKTNASFGTYDSGNLHNGVDVVPKDYTKGDGKDHSVYPVAPGKIYRVGTEKDKDGNITGYGHYVVVQHTLSDGTTVYSRYAHLKEASKLKEGKDITVDTTLGIMGDTGNATGPHVHLEVYNTRYESKWYGKHKPEDEYDEQMTWEQKMKDGYYDPIQVINGDIGWQFKTSKTPEGAT